jgi:hypothetical protein
MISLDKNQLLFVAMISLMLDKILPRCIMTILIKEAFSTWLNAEPSEPELGTIFNLLSIADVERLFSKNRQAETQLLIKSIKNTYDREDDLIKEGNFNYLKRFFYRLDTFCNANEDAFKTKSMYADIARKTLELAIEKSDCNFTSFLIVLRGSMNTSQSNAYQHMQPSQHKIFCAITDSLSKSYLSGNENILFRNITVDVQNTFEKWVNTPEFSERVDYFVKKFPDMAVRLDFSKLAKLSIVNFNPHSLNTSLKYCYDNTHDAVLPSSYDALALNSSTIQPDDVTKTISLITDRFSHTENLLERIAVVFDTFAICNNHDTINRALSSHGLANNSLYNAINDSTKELYLSLKLSETLDDAISEGIQYNELSEVLSFDSCTMSI